MEINTHDIMMILAGAGMATFWICAMMVTFHVKDASKNYLKAIRLKRSATLETSAPTSSSVPSEPES